MLLLLFAQVTGNRPLEERVETVDADYLSGAKNPARDFYGRRLEHRWFGIIPLQLAVTRGGRYQAVSRIEADIQVAEPAKDSDLYYVDAMYGVGTLQAKALLHLGGFQIRRALFVASFDSSPCAAAAGRAVSSFRARASDLGTKQWMGSGGHDRGVADAARQSAGPG